ncbi:MAG: threonylcarbamoyl-AMP synthase [Lachnospiraceae bacterium]|nr:threonylcarbamoyl-AMP synthase [Lachnospiraceae bacterium]
MDTKYIKITELNNEIEQIQQAGQILKEGGLVAFPTETVYGLGGHALNPQSSHKIYAAKGRPSDNPLIVHICKWEDLAYIVEEIPPEAKKLAEQFWPGPLTMIFRKSDVVPYETTGGLETVAVRMPDHPVALALIEAAGGYVAAPSANTSGRPSPTLAKYVMEDMAGRIDMVLDGGEIGIGIESTIVDLTGEVPEILRPGYVTREMLQEQLGKVETDQTILSNESDLKPKAPGMKYRHYAPKGDLTLVSGAEDKVTNWINQQLELAKASGKVTAVICTQETQDKYKADFIKCAGSRNDEAQIARQLYRILRELDDDKADVIFAEAFETKGMGQAIMNRLLKAAGHHIEYV